MVELRLEREAENNAGAIVEAIIGRPTGTGWAFLDADDMTVQKRPSRQCRVPAGSLCYEFFRSRRKWPIKALVEASCSALASSSMSSGKITPASCLPSSTPH